MKRVTKLDEDQVSDVRDVVDAPQAHGFEPRDEPRWRRRHLYSSNHARGVSRAQRSVSYLDGSYLLGPCLRLFQLREWQFPGLTRQRGHLACDPKMRKAVRSIRSQVKFKDGMLTNLFH